MEHLKEKILDGIKSDIKLRPKNPNPVRIKINGEYISLGNTNKPLWNSLGEAKSALRCHFKSTITDIILKDSELEPMSNYANKNYYSSKDKDKVWNEFMSWAVEDKFIEFVEV